MIEIAGQVLFEFLVAFGWESLKDSTGPEALVRFVYVTLEWRPF